MKATGIMKKYPVEYKVWQAIKDRCLNHRCSFYDRYGGRGITMHAEWVNDSQAFVEYVRNNLGERPSTRHSLDRIDNEGHYEPGNLRWASYEEQNRNRRRTKFTGKLDSNDVAFIKYWRDMGYKQKHVAAAFGVDSSHIYRIESGEAWSERQG